MLVFNLGCGNDSPADHDKKAKSQTEDQTKKANAKTADAQKKQDAQAAIDDFIDSHSQKYDQARQLTWVDSVGSYPFDHKGIYTYMGIQGKNKTDHKFLRAKIHYSASDWVFFKSIIFSNSDSAWTYDVDFFSKDTEVVTSGVHELSDVPFVEIKPGIKLLLEGQNPMITFMGDHGKCDVHLSPEELNNLRTYMQLQEYIDICQ